MSVMSGGSQVLSMDTLVRLHRGLAPQGSPVRLVMPDGMTAPLGCDAVAVPARLGPLILPRLPHAGCVYADEAYWWWIVPADSDYALAWPEPTRYVTGALVSDAVRLIHRPEGSVPYTPPIPLYLALCRFTGVAPSWSRQVSA